MTPFLKELAEQTVRDHDRLDDLTFVFPNRRAALYFENYLGRALDKPKWAPRLQSIEQFFKLHSNLREPDHLTLVYRLHQVYGDVLKNQESFDKFYFWGEMLLRDFDEIDKYLVNAPQLFKDLSKIKELDETFDYLTEEQRKFLQEFWSHFSDKPTNTKEQFLFMWRKLPKVYNEFGKSLRKESLGYEGMIHREVAEKFLKKIPASIDPSTYVFAGFNALTRAEESVLGAMAAHGAKVVWDADTYYVDNPVQEAGQFMREYRRNERFASTFAQSMPSNFLESPKKITVTAVPQRIGQAKLAGVEVGEILARLPKEDLPMELSKTVVVLPDEGMLLPVMHSLPGELLDINVTMGFPLRDTPMFALLDQAIEMQIRKRKDSFNHREVTGILGHAYVLTLAEQEAQAKALHIVRNNRVQVPFEDLTGEDTLFGLIFKPVESKDATAYLLELVEQLGARVGDRKSFDREYAYHFHQHLSRLHAIFGQSESPPDWRGFQKLFRQVTMTQKIPFTGEPLRGLQIMGVLETRNLDFDHVIILSLNEGQLPAAPKQGSYVPHSIRRAYGLPTFEQLDSIYAYLFYRVLQRASHISFYYSTEPDIVGNGEASRYLQQVLLESQLPIEQRVLHNPIHVHAVKGISVFKSEEIQTQLDKYIREGDERPYHLTPSSLNDYVECTLRFYLKHIANLREADEVEEDVDARIFGNILHDVMFWLYQELRPKRNGVVLQEDLDVSNAQIDAWVDRAFRKLYRLEDHAEITYEGKRVVVKEVVRTFVRKVLERDSEYAPFEVKMLEESFNQVITLTSGKRVRIGGKIDRADVKEGRVRVIDYKTGRDDLGFESVESLFDGSGKHNKAAFQTLLYSYVYQLGYGDPQERIQPGLMNRNNLFGTDFKFGFRLARSKEPLDDVRALLPEFGARLQTLVEELYDPTIPFTQTTNENSCKYCLYKALCRR